MRPNLQDAVDLITFIEEILNEKLQFLCRANPNTFTYTEDIFYIRTIFRLTGGAS